MAAEITLDTLRIDVEKLEAIPIDLANPPACYPQNPLRGTKERTTVESRVAILENPKIRVMVGLDLGGRLLEIADKRTGVAVLPAPARLDLAPAGLRGIRSAQGVPLTVFGGDRPNALGSVEFSVRPPDEEDDAAELWMFEIVAGYGMSWHQRITLPRDTADFEIELRCVNRTFDYTAAKLSYQFEGWRVASRSQTPPFEERVILSSPHGGALGIAFDRREAWLDEKSEEVALCLHDGPLTPRRAMRSTIRLSPIGLEAVRAFTSEAAMALDGSAVTVALAGESGKCTLFLRTAGGQTLESTVDFGQSDVARLDAPSVPDALLLRGPTGRTLAEWSKEETEPLPTDWLRSESPPPFEPEATLASAFRESPPDAEKLILGVRQGGKSGLPFIAAAVWAVDRQDWVLASQELDEALSHQADDPLTWWFKAAVERRAGGQDQTPLLNAHFLAPLDPALRAESLLAQEPPEGRGPNPLLASMAESPEHLIEVACLYLEARLFEDAHRWIDESLRHRDHPMLHYLLAWAYLRRSRMETEAAAEIARARSAPLAPPMPWRPFEALVLEELAVRFPGEARLQAFLTGVKHARLAIIRMVWPECS
ncbi:MAG TPA: DUF5107 domain-containing protein [Fimbriimonadaceae bacterium]|nr:DUF5107 domain-containing protein [Fimbriimonadaceae bacterium]HRJ97638.1 DUF5107 domain-containing protein [Fimbriimonadaceae bacterium]